MTRSKLEALYKLSHWNHENAKGRKHEKEEEAEITRSKLEAVEKLSQGNHENAKGRKHEKEEELPKYGTDFF